MEMTVEFGAEDCAMAIVQAAHKEIRNARWQE
jgi:hypothetical protein